MILKQTVSNAIRRHNSSPNVTNKKNLTELARIYYPESSLNSARVNLYRLLTGSHKFIEVSKIGLICDYLECTPNELFGYEIITY